jgi:hypothetical protein
MTHQLLMVHEFYLITVHFTVGLSLTADVPHRHMKAATHTAVHVANSCEQTQ